MTFKFLVHHFKRIILPVVVKKQKICIPIYLHHVKFFIAITDQIYFHLANIRMCSYLNSSLVTSSNIHMFIIYGLSFIQRAIKVLTVHERIIVDSD